MRVLFLTHRLPYAPNRGDRLRAFHLLRLLTERHEVHLVSLVHDQAEAAHVDDLRGTIASVTGVPVPRWRNFAAVPGALLGDRPLTHVLLHGPGMAAALRHRVQSARPDVVLAYCSGMVRYALEDPLTSIPFVFDMVDVDSRKWTDLSTSTQGPRRWIYAREGARLLEFERRAMARARATTVVSERERAVLEESAPESRALVVPNGVDVHALTPTGAPTHELRVVFCGVFNYQPNADGAIWFATDVWPLVQAAEPGARLSLVGMHPTRSVRALTRNNSIEVTGAVADVRAHLWGAAVGVAPLLVARGVQNKVLEAVAAGIPCVVTPTVAGGLPPQVLTACPTAGDDAQFAGSVVDLLGRAPEERRAIAASAHVETLNWPIQLAPVLALLDEAARGRR